MSNLRINSIMNNPSLCDGYGYRTVVFLQGCNLRCPGCQNPSTWDINKGISVDVKDLAHHLREKCLNKKLTISGGEPLLQAEALKELLEELKEVPKEILKYLKYIKVGRFILEQRTSTKPFVGSTNQKFVRIHHEEAK